MVSGIRNSSRQESPFCSSGAISGTVLGFGHRRDPYNNFVVQVKDNTGDVAFEQLSFTLHNPAITLTPSILPVGSLTAAYNAGVTASGGSGGPYTYTFSGTPPPGLIINASTGAITGLPGTAWNI